MAIETGAPRTRRAILAAGLGGLGATLLQAVGRPTPAAAANGDPVLAGQTTVATATTEVDQSTAGLDGLVVTTMPTANAIRGSGPANTVGVRGQSVTGYGMVAESQSGSALYASNSTLATSSEAFRAVAQGNATAIIGVSGPVDVPQVSKIGVYGYANQDANARAVYGKSLLGTGIWGNSDSGRGLFGRSTSGTGVSAQTDTGRAVYGTTAATNKTAILGQNTNGGSSGVQGFSGGGNPPTPDAQTGVQGNSDLSVTANGVLGRSTVGTGVWGDTTDGFAVAGTGSTANSVGMYAAGGIGLYVSGPSFFSTSDKTTITSGSSVTVAVPGGVGPDSIGLATLQTNRAGVWVRAVTTNVTNGTITIYLNVAVSASTIIGWYLIN